MFRHACKLGPGRHRVEAAGLALRLRALERTKLKMKNPDAPAVQREAEEEWGKEKWR